jgi:hypothetical protein
MRATSQIRVRPLGNGFACVSIVAGGWSISGIKVSARGRIEWPMTDGKGGRRYPVVSPPSHLRLRLESEILEACERFA